MAASQGRAAAVLRDAELVSILFAPDADSVLAAGQVALALHRAKVPWHARPAAALTKEALAPLAEEAPGQPVLLCGLGGPEPAALEGLPGEAVVLDARWPRPGGQRGIVVEDPLPSASAASLAFELARALDPRAPPLPAIAGLDAAGTDGSEGVRARLVDEALPLGARHGPVPALGPGPLVEALAGCVEPYLPGLTGRARAGKKFLEGLGLGDAGPVDEVPVEAAGRLTSALTLHLLAKGVAAAATRPLLVPDVRAPWPGGSARGLARLCTAALGAQRPGLALALAMGDPRGERDAMALAEPRHQRLLQALLKLEGAEVQGPLRAEPDLAPDLAWACAAALRGGAPVAALGEPTRLHVAAPGADPRFLGAAAHEAAAAVGGTGAALGPRATLDVPPGTAPKAWDHLRRALGVLA